MKPPRIVIDTNVLVSGLRSRQGASNRLLGLIGTDKFEINVSVPLVIEFEKVLYDAGASIPYSKVEIDKILDYVCANSRHILIHYLWRPYLRDPKDDMVLELAVSSGSGYIVTFNRSDFEGSSRFGIKIVQPREFLKTIGELP